MFIFRGKRLLVFLGLFFAVPLTLADNDNYHYEEYGSGSGSGDYEGE